MLYCSQRNDVTPLFLGLRVSGLMCVCDMTQLQRPPSKPPLETHLSQGSAWVNYELLCSQASQRTLGLTNYFYIVYILHRCSTQEFCLLPIYYILLIYCFPYTIGYILYAIYCFLYTIYYI